MVTDRPGSVVGMYISVPSSRLGMNSEPSWRAGQTETASTNRASRMVGNFARRTRRITGR